MKKLMTSIALCTLLALFTMASIAQQTMKQQNVQSVVKNTGMGKMHMGMDGMHRGMMGKMMENMSEEEKTKYLRAMQDHMLRMHDLSNKILATKNAKKKEKLRQKQIALMNSHMDKMMARRNMMRQQQKQMRKTQQ